jgi:hypothetical protein
VSWSGEVCGGRDWYANSYRFETQEEARCFIQQLREQWIPVGFVRDVRTSLSKQPVNARWHYKKQDVIRLPVSAKDEAAAALQPEENNVSKRKDTKSKLRYSDFWITGKVIEEAPGQTWEDPIDSVLGSQVLRNDLRHLMTHGACRYELSRKLYEGFKTAHDGVAPEDVGQYTVRTRVAPKNRYWDRYIFDQAEGVQARTAMEELTWWLTLPEIRARHQKEMESFAEVAPPIARPEDRVARKAEAVERAKRKLTEIRKFGAAAKGKKRASR